MAAAQALAGPNAVYFVVPLFGALAVWLTFVLGRSIHGARTGTMAAVLLSVSPVFLFQVVQPLTDVPAAAAWLAVLVLASRPGISRALAAASPSRCPRHSRSGSR